MMVYNVVIYTEGGIDAVPFNSKTAADAHCEAIWKQYGKAPDFYSIEVQAAQLRYAAPKKGPVVTRLTK